MRWTYIHARDDENRTRATAHCITWIVINTLGINILPHAGIEAFRRFRCIRQQENKGGLK